MAYDIKQNLQTGDWEFDSKRDYAGSEGVDLIQQRIHRRLAIVRGSYIYTESGLLGSRLRSLLRMGVPLAANSIEMIVHEALAPMDDIIITDIQISTFGDGSGIVTDPRTVRAKIEYQLNTATLIVSTTIAGEFETTVDIPV